MPHRAYLPQDNIRRVEGLTREEACRTYQRKVVLIARRVRERLSSAATVEQDDIISWGAIGLLEAFDRYDGERGIKFSTYAEYRIRGAIYDALRTQDNFSRRRRQLAKRVEHAHQEIERSAGRAPTPQEVANRLEVSLDQYHKAVDTTKPVTHYSLDDVGPGGRPLMETLTTQRFIDPTARISSAEVRELLSSAVGELPSRQQECILMYYGKELSLAEIAAVYDVSVSRVSQVLKEARTRLRKRLSADIGREDLELETA